MLLIDSLAEDLQTVHVDRNYYNVLFHELNTHTTHVTNPEIKTKPEKSGFSFMKKNLKNTMVRRQTMTNISSFIN